MPKKQTKQSGPQSIDQDAIDLLAGLENSLAAAAPFFPPADASTSLLSDEFVSLCLRTPNTPREDTRIALSQMQAILENLPLPILVQNSDWLTVRTLLQFALESQSPMPRLRCGALGYLYLERNGVNGRTKRTSEIQGELLSFFLMQPRRPWSDEQIFETLWPGKEQQHAQWAFHTARKRLHEFARVELILKLKRGQYSLNPDIPIWFDVTEFQGLVTRAYTIPNGAVRIKLLERAVQLYRGDFLEKNYKDWCVPIRAHLREKYISALLQLGELTESETPAQAILWYEKALYADDLNEDTWLKLIRLHVQTNNPIAAQRTLILCLDTFQRELASQPSALFLQTAHTLTHDNAIISFAKGR